MNDKEYKRVSCDFYDQLEIHASRKSRLKIKFVNEDEETKELKTAIKTLETKNKEEFLVTESGHRLRLDRILGLSEEE